MLEKIPFSLLGFDLLEPMAFLTNGLVAFVCVWGFLKSQMLGITKWKYFFLFFSLASFTGALSHLFWNYWGFYGKIAPWLFGVFSSGLLLAAMIDLFSFRKSTRLFFHVFIFVKGAAILVLAFSFWNFLFVAIDTILSLFLACGLGTIILFFHYGRKDLINILIGFIIMLPSAAVFLLKIDLHLWLNREDISHILIALGLFFFTRNLDSIANAATMQSDADLNDADSQLDTDENLLLEV